MKRFCWTTGLLISALSLTLLAGSGCGAGGGDALDQSLSGCPGCMENGICRPFSAQDSTACGSGGRTCERCQEGAQACDRDVGRCVAANPSTCPGGVCQPVGGAKKPCGLLCDGCCDTATNTCVETNAGQSAQKCGVNSQVCRACDAGQGCSAGACVFGAPISGGGTVTGASQCNTALQCYSPTTKTCELGDSVLACGRPGMTCGVCTNGQYCSNGTCVAGTNRIADCQRGGCDGCCTPDGTCVGSWSLTDSQCGIRGGACQVCTNQRSTDGSGKVCVKDTGRCVDAALARPLSVCIDSVWVQKSTIEGNEIPEDIEVRVEVGESTFGFGGGTLSGSTDGGTKGLAERCPNGMSTTKDCWQVTFGNPCALTSATNQDLTNKTVNFEVGHRGFFGFEPLGGSTLATCRVRGEYLVRYYKDGAVSPTYTNPWGTGGYTDYVEPTVPKDRLLTGCSSSAGYLVKVAVRVTAQ
jgi:hypothetical protein